MTELQTTQTTTKPSKWGEAEKSAWFEEQIVKRSYIGDVVSRVDLIENNFEIINYGALSCAPDHYPLFLVITKNWQPDKKVILITGGVHGYETSGIMGALDFLEEEAANYETHFNIVVAPCVSPWSYETINRWDPKAVDPNRSFVKNSSVEECALLMNAIAKLDCEIWAHIDLHETTDTDNSVFRPALSARDGIEQDNWNIPDGFYCVGDINNPVDEFQKAIIDSVKKVTHISPPDQNGQIIGEPVTQEGVINYAIKKLGLCAGFTNCQFSTTTEVYPDSDRVTDEDCTRAQVAAITGGLDYLVSRRANSPS